jgi:hypothetical protein
VIRSADTDEIFYKYNRLKDIRKKLYFDENVKKDPKIFAELQREAQLTEADLRGGISESKEVAKGFSAISSGVMQNPFKFDTKKTSLLPQFIETPTSKLKEMGATTPNFFLYGGVDLPKLSAWKKAAMGSPKDIESGTPRQIYGGYKMEKDVLSRPNDPINYFNSLVSNFATNQAGQAAQLLMSEMNPAEKTQIINNFEAIPKEEFEAKWGIKKEDLLKKQGSPDDLANQYVLLDAMKYATDNLPKVVKTKQENNVEFIEKKKAERFKAAEAGKLRRTNILAAAKNKELQGGDDEGTVIEEIDIIDELPTDKGNVIISGGEVRGKNGELFNGTVTIPRSKMPTQLYSVLKAGGVDDDFLMANKGFTANVKDGKIQALSEDRIGVISRGFLRNAQLKLDTEPQKGKKLSFGSAKKQEQKSNKKTVVGKKDNNL